MSHINSIVKTVHAFIFPTAIRIETQNSAYLFTSFRSRSHTLDHLTNLLNQSRQVVLILLSTHALMVLVKYLFTASGTCNIFLH